MQRTLQKYLPERAVVPCSELIKQNNVHLKIVNERVTRHGDYRKLLSEQGPEIVLVGTPDHWHALHSLAAMRADLLTTFAGGPSSTAKRSTTPTSPSVRFSFPKGERWTYQLEYAANSRIDAVSGEVRGFDARTGALRWTWHPVPQDSTDPGWKTWIGPNAHRTGAANAWSVMTARKS